MAGLTRDLDLEREIVREACRGLVDPTAIIQHAQARAETLSGEYVFHPHLIRPGLDRVREIREELADVVNHALYLMQEHMDEVGGELWLTMSDVIAVATRLYERLA